MAAGQAFDGATLGLSFAELPSESKAVFVTDGGWGTVQRTADPDVSCSVSLAVAHGCVALRTLVLPSTAKKVRAKKNGSVVPCAATSKGAARSLSLSFKAELALEPGDELTIQLA